MKLFYTFEKLNEEFIIFPYTLTIFNVDLQIIDILEQYTSNIICYDDLIENLKITKNSEHIEIMSNFVPYIEQEYSMMKYIHNYKEDENKKANLMTLQINTNYSCNMKCKYCFAEEGCHGKEGSMDEEDIHTIYNFVNENSVEKQFKLVLVGGEPLLNKKYIYRLIDNGKEFSDKDLSYIIITNGTLLDDELLNLMQNNQLMLNISLDSNEKIINDYLRPMRNKVSAYDTLINDKFLKLKDLKKRVSLNCTITKKNLFIGDMFKKFYEEGFTKFHFEEVITKEDDLKLDKESAEVLIKEYEKIMKYIIEIIDKNQEIACYPLTNELGNLHKGRNKMAKCDAMEGIVAVSPDLKIYPCDMLMWDQYEIGTVKDGFNVDKIKQLNDKLFEAKGNCENCWNRYICGGLCLSEANSISEEELGIRCRIKKEISKNKIYLYTYIMNNNPDYINRFL